MTRQAGRTSAWRHMVLAGGTAIVVVAVASLPYLIAFLATPPDWQFGGFLSNPVDGNSYLAKMRQGARGEWLFHLPYTAEDHPGAVLYPYYLLLGHLAAWTNVPLIAVYHLARLAGGLALLASLYCFCRLLLTSAGARWAAFLTLSLGSGFGWLAAPLGHLTADLLIPEATMFHALFASPHFSLALALLLLTLLALARSLVEDRLLWSLLAGLAALILVFVQPFLAASVYAVGGAWVLLAAARAPARVGLVRLLWRPARHLLVVGALSAPAVVLSATSLYLDPVLSRWTVQNVTPSPPPWDYILGLGWPALLAFPGVAVALRRPAHGALAAGYAGFLVAWVATVAVLLYLPFALQRRLVEGLQAPVVVLGVAGLLALLPAKMVAGRRHLFLACAVALAVPGSMFLLGVSTLGALQKPPLIYLAQDEVAALAWLGAHTTADTVVLASPETGNLIPAWAGNRVFYGHPFETVDAAAKLDLVRRFYRGEMDPAAQQAFLSRYGIRYVYYGSFERALSGDWSGDGLPLQPVYAASRVVIYRFDAQRVEATE